MKKSIKFISVFMSFVIVLTAFSVFAFADDINYSYDENTYTLTIYGSGNMSDVDDEYSQPWRQYATKAKCIIVDNGITSLGKYAFSGFNKAESILLPDSLTTINQHAFASCNSLKELTLSNNVTSIADTSFAFIGGTKKDDFTLVANLGSYALSYAIQNGINYSCDKVVCNNPYSVYIPVKKMEIFYPYTPKYSGEYKFYSTGNWNTYGELYDSSMNLLVYNDDYSDNNNDLNFGFTYNLEKGKTYYFGAKLRSNFLYNRTFEVAIEPLSYTVIGKFTAMADPSGKASDIPLSGVTLDSETLDSSFELNITPASSSKTFVYNNQSLTYTFSPDEDVNISFVAVDANGDGYVNAKDFALLKKQSSPYLSLYKNFVNYKV